MSKLPVNKKYCKTLSVFGLIMFCILGYSCKKDKENRVPYVPIEVTLSLDLPSYAPLQNPGGWVYLDGGSKGLIIYRASLDDFTVVDRHCTYQVENFCQVAVDSSSGILAKDNACCGSVFSIVDGSVVSSPAKRPLETYTTMFNSNANTLRIYN